MENLWATWRSVYVSGEKPQECVFCHPQDYVLCKNESVYVIMNLYPYNNGHVMIIPNRHVADFTELTSAERHAIADMTDITIRVLKKTLNPDGFNVGYNLGAAAGAGVAAHLHQHIVPRWSGDTNFMPIVAETKVISEHINITYEKLLNAFGGFFA